MESVIQAELEHTKKQLQLQRIQHDEKDVQAIIDCFASGLVRDPFSEDNRVLSNITTGVVLPAEKAEKLVHCTARGLVQLNSFTEKHLNSNVISF